MYADVTTLVDDIITIYDNTDNSEYLQNREYRRARVVHYLQRTAENLWFHRAWPFAMASAQVLMATGSASLPDTFARISAEGAFLDTNGIPWVEISYQDMAYLRDRRIQQQAKLFSIGSVVEIPDVTSTATFTMVFQTQAPTMTYGGELGFPQAFGQALLLGTVMKLKEEEGDARTIWRTDYQSALATVGTLYKRASRVEQMPQTIGGMW